MFFKRLQEGGGRIAWAEGAVVFAPIPKHRMRPQWLWRRWYRTGDIEASLGRYDPASTMGRLHNLMRGLARARRRQPPRREGGPVGLVEKARCIRCSASTRSAAAPASSRAWLARATRSMPRPGTARAGLHEAAVERQIAFRRARQRQRIEYELARPVA